MDTLIKADLFFFVTTVSIVILVILVATLLVYAIRAIRNFYLVSRIIRKEAEATVNVWRSFREFMEEKGNYAIGFLMKVIPFAFSKVKKSNKK